MKLFERDTEQQIGYRYYITAPRKLDTAERVKNYDNYARDAIKEMQGWIQALQDYRQQLYERYQEIAQANSRLQLKIHRDIDSYRGTKKWYYVELLKLYDRAGYTGGNSNCRAIRGERPCESVRAVQGTTKAIPDDRARTRHSKKTLGEITQLRPTGGGQSPPERRQ